MTAKVFSHALGEINDKYVLEAINYTVSKKNNRWIKYGVIAACLCLCIGIGIRTRMNDNFIPLNIDSNTSIGMAAQAHNSPIGIEQTDRDNTTVWLGMDLQKNLPKEMANYLLEYWFLIDRKTNGICGVTIEGGIDDDTMQSPHFIITITENLISQSFHFESDISTDINGVVVFAAARPAETRINRDGEEIFIPARYYSKFNVGEYHCAVETDGMISEEAFSQLINVLVDCMLDMIENHLDRSTIDRVSSDETEKAEMSENTGGGAPLAPEEMEEDTEDIVGNVSHMIIQSGKSGQRESLKDTDSVQQIMADIKYLNYKKMQPMEEMEYAYSITFFNEAYEELGIIYILDDSGLEIIYEGYEYLIEPDASINIAGIAEELLKDAPPAEPEEPEEGV